MIGEIKPPFSIYVDQLATFDFVVPFRNELMLKARRLVENLIQDKSKDKQKPDKDKIS